MAGKDMYIVSNFTVLGCELKDGMEDISFLQMNGVFHNKAEAEAFAHEFYWQEKTNPENEYKYSKIEDSSEGKTYYLSHDKIGKNDGLTDLNGLVINVRAVKVNPKLVSK